MGSPVRAFLRQELAGLAAVAWRSLWLTLLVCLALGVAVSLAAHADAQGARASLSAQLLVGAGLGLYYGAFVAVAAAAFAALWRLFGPALLVVLLVAPLCAFAVLWLLRSPLSSTAIGFLDSVIASARQQGLAHTAEAASGLRLGCGGGGVAVLLLVLLAPFLLADLAVILASAGVLGAFLKFAGAMALALGAALLVALLFASPVLLFALVRRGRRRYAAMAR
jgi:hypothetical protein